MLLTDNHLTIVVGIDIHFTTLPPFNPFHPYIGIVIDPTDYIPFLGTDVHVNGFKRGNSDTGGIIIPLVHIPLFTPPWLMTPIIGHESMNFFASETVYSDGTRLSPKGHMLVTCNDIGIPLSMSIGKTKIGKKMLPFAPTLFAPTSFSLPIPTGKPVKVGGPYPPDWGGMLTGLLASIGFSTLMKFGKKAFNKLLKGSIGPNWLSKLLCKAGFEPVNLVNGAVIYEGSDFDIAGPIALNWERHWYSDSQYRGWLGHGVHCVYDRAVELYPDDDALGLRMDDGRLVAFPALMPEEEFYLRQEKTTLKRTQNGYQAYDHKDKLFYDFTLFDGKKYQLTQIANHDGLCIIFEFAGHRLNKIIDTAGREIKISTKDGFIQKLELIAPKQNELLVAYEYDENSNMTAIIDALGKPTNIQFENHLMVQKTDRNGQTFYWEYDSQNRCVHTWGDGGWQEGWLEYHPEDGYNLVTDANGAITTYYYEPSQLVTQIKDPMGNSVFYDYTEFMELYREIDQEGRITGFNYDDWGNKTSTTYPDNTQEILLYDEHRPSIAIDPEGNKTVYLYKKQKTHQLKTIIAPDKTTTHFTYNAHGLLNTVAKNDNELQLVYDQQYNLIEWHENGQKLKTWEYDHRGRVKAIYTPMQMADYFTYDALDRVQQIIEKDSNIIEFAYNSYDEVIALKDKKNSIKFSYTPMGSLATREQNGVKVRFDYDKMEQLTAIKNEDNEAYYFDRNKAGYIIKETAFDGIVKKYNRNLAGEVTRIDHGNGKYTEYEQDALGRITRADYHDGSWETYTYNKNGLLTEAANQNVTISFERDAAGRIVKETQKQQLDAAENGITLTAGYNALGQRTSISTSLGTNINTQYNQKGQLDRIEAQSKELKEQHQSWETTLKRDELGREIERFATGGLHIKTSYNSSGKQKEQEVFANGKRSGSRFYNWDTCQQLRSKVNQMTKSMTYFDYDDFGNLARASYDGKGELYKTPDAVGNLYKTQDRSDRKYGKGGKLLKDEKYYYKYDQLGNLVHKSPRDITKPLVFEKPTNWIDRLAGNKEEETRLQKEHESWQYGDTAYTWLANGMLESIQNPDGKIVRFEYDALGRRTAKIANKQINRYFWDGNVLIHEWKYDLKERPKLVIIEDDLVYDKTEPVDNLITWVYEGGSFVPSAKIIGEEKFSIVNDYIGRPVQVYNENGEVVWDTDYDIYGDLREFKGDRSFIPFRQLGQYEDAETGLYYNRFRYYNPETGTYLSQDPIGLSGNNPNLYAYVHDANGWTDIFGLAGTPWMPHGAAQPDVISKGPHFYAGDGKTELKLALEGDKIKFVEVFGKDADTPALTKAIKEAEEKLISDKAWREKLLQNAKEVKMSLFENFGRLDRAREVKKIEKALKKLCK